MQLVRCRHIADKHVASEALDVATDARGSFPYVCVCVWCGGWGEGGLGSELTKLRAIFANIREFIMNPLLKFYTTVCHSREQLYLVNTIIAQL